MSNVKHAVGKFGLPLAAVFVGSLGVVLVMQDRAVSAIQAAAVSAPAATPAQVVQFDPFAVQPATGAAVGGESRTIVIQQAAEGYARIPVGYSSSVPAPVQQFVDLRSTGTADTSVQTGGGVGAESTSSSTSTSGNVINVPTATINVGNADINVASSFRLFYGGHLVASGSNG